MSSGDYDRLLRLTIDTDRPVRARDAARIITGLSLVFAKLPRDRYTWSVEHYELRLVRIHSGSLIADMMGFAGGFVTLNDFYDAAVRLIRGLNEARNMMAIRTKRGFKDTDSSCSQEQVETVAAMSAPILYDQARSVTLQINGDNNNIFMLDHEGAATVQKYIRNSHELLRRDDPPEPSYVRTDMTPQDVRKFRSAARRGVRGTALKVGSSWEVAWPVWPGEVWRMHLVAEAGILERLTDGAAYIFTGKVSMRPSSGPTFTATSAEYWEHAPYRDWRPL